MNQDFQTEFMALAIGLAKQGLGKTKPNPSVGAVVIKNGMVLGGGFHMKAGQEHAEVLALNEAGPDAKGATLYVTLEHCAHHGKTPPCVDLIISSGIKRVVVASLDPNTQVNGKGLDVLRKNGIEEVVGEEEVGPEWRTRSSASALPGRS